MSVVSPLPTIIQHGRHALPGHIGLRPGHPLNPYSPLGLWYYVPRFTRKFLRTVVGVAPVDHSAPYFGMANVQDYLNDLAMHTPVATPFSGGEPVQRALPASGQISMNQIHALFGRGNNLAAYRGTRWYFDNGQYGNFPSGAISLQDFYSKRPDDPVVPGAWDQQTAGYSDFYTPVHRAIQVQRVGAGGGSGSMNARGGDGNQTWAFTGGSPANGGTGGGFLYTNGTSGYWTEQEYAGRGGSWGAPGNAGNQAGTNGGTVGGTGTFHTYDTGSGGNSAWAAGGAGFRCAVGGGYYAGNVGSLGSGGGGGMNNNGAGLYGFGDGGGGGGYTYDSWGAGVIGGVVNVYCAQGGSAQAGGWGGNGRIYVGWQ